MKCSLFCLGILYCTELSGLGGMGEGTYLIIYPQYFLVSFRGTNLLLLCLI